MSESSGEFLADATSKFIKLSTDTLPLPVRPTVPLVRSRHLSYEYSHLPTPTRSPDLMWKDISWRTFGPS